MEEQIKLFKYYQKIYKNLLNRDKRVKNQFDIGFESGQKCMLEELTFYLLRDMGEEMNITDSIDEYLLGYTTPECMEE